MLVALFHSLNIQSQIKNEINWDHCCLFEGELELMAPEDLIIHSPLEQEAPGQVWDSVIVVESCPTLVFHCLINRNFKLQVC